MTQSKTIGILAGMGPRSTAPFVDLVISECQRQYGATRDLDFPPLMIYSLPTPFDLDGPLDHDEMKRVICAGLQRLEATGVAFVAMPCNSAHIYYEDLIGCIRVPLINMIDEALLAFPDGVKQMALLATRITAGAELYQSGAKRLGIEMVVREAWQAQVDSVIEGVKLGELEAARSQWRGLLTEIEAAGLNSAIIACTDLNQVSAGGAGRLTMLDATECLARETVRRWRGLT